MENKVTEILYILQDKETGSIHVVTKTAYERATGCVPILQGYANLVLIDEPSTPNFSTPN